MKKRKLFIRYVLARRYSSWHIVGMQNHRFLLEELVRRCGSEDAVAALLLVSQPTVSRWKRGTLKPSPRALKTIIDLAIEKGIILGAAARGVPLMGLVGAGAEIDTAFEQPSAEGFERIDLPGLDEGGWIGFEVKGESMVPAYDPGDIVIVRKRDPSHDPRQLIGERAVVVCIDADGERRRYLKRIKAGDRVKRFDLESINDRSPTIRDVAIVWAAPVEHVHRRIGLRRLAAKVKVPRRPSQPSSSPQRKR